MDYEKAYKAVLKTATQWIKDGCTDKEKICLECVFPELRGSEDERIRKWLVDYFSSIKATVWIHRDITCEQILDWLEKQKEQKPAEWSEEDADILNCCISSIEEAKENRYAYKETDGDTSYDREIDWLKSLRPDTFQNGNSRWKPSEEQMEALRKAVNKLANMTKGGIRLLVFAA